MTKTVEQMQPGDVCCGFELTEKRHIEAFDASCYILHHKKTGTELLYMDRPDENKTFSISFKTLPEDNTGVFHILEHSVLNGSRRFPVKEPFVSLLQSSMQTFLNAMTYGDKTVFPVSSRNEKDLFNLMRVYLDGVFAPLIYEKPEIFMQEGWHYEFGEEGETPWYNGVVFSEMKGEFADVEQVIDAETTRLLFPDTSSGYISGGLPEEITDLTYEKFLATHKRFYHPSNATIILDGHMQVEKFLRYIDEEYLSNYTCQAPDFDFSRQEPKTAEKTVFYEAQKGQEELCHMSMAKILCLHDEPEKIYAAQILCDYLTGSNEAPLKRAFLEQGLAQDVSLVVSDQVYQPSISLVVYNTKKDCFAKIKESVPERVRTLATQGLDREALSAALERSAFENREIHEPYGVEVVGRVLAGWLYGDDPLTFIEDEKIFDSLRKKLSTGYFEQLLLNMLGDETRLSCLYVLPSVTKGGDEARKEAEKVQTITDGWDEKTTQDMQAKFEKMQTWQQSMDSEAALLCLPHLELSDVPQEMKTTETVCHTIGDTTVLQVKTETNGIVYLQLYFDISDYSMEDLQLVNAISDCFGELQTVHVSADKLQTKIKALFGQLSAKTEVIAKPGDLENSRQYLLVSASMLEKNVPQAMEILKELLVYGRYDDKDRILEMVMQDEYVMKQSLIGNGHQFAITKALSAFSAEDAMKEVLEGESFIRWYSTFAEDYRDNAGTYGAAFNRLMARAFEKGRLFVGYSGNLPERELQTLIGSLPEGHVGESITCPMTDTKDSTIEIPASVGFSALGSNLYALGGSFNGSFAVLSSLMSFGYLWNAIRVQGGAYGTGMGVQMNGDIFSYSYRDPDLKGTKEAYGQMADFLEDFLAQDMPLDDIVIGTIAMIDPLLSPAGICDQACTRYLKGITNEAVDAVRNEVLKTTGRELGALKDILQEYLDKGKFCAVGDTASLQNICK